MSFFFDIFTSLDCIFKRVSFGRILLSFYNVPAIKIALVHIVKDGFEVHIAISRHSNPCPHMLFQSTTMIVT